VSDGSPQNNFSWSNNLIQDIQGTAYWSIVNGGDASNWQVFNNVIFQTQGSSRPGVSGGGFFACVNPGTNCTNIKIIGNTFINDRSDYDNSFTIHAPDTSGNTFTLQNNLFYQITSAQTTNPIGTPDVNGTVTADHNTFLNVGSPNGLSGGTGDVTVASGSPNPFVNWPGYNFQLTGNSTNWNSGLTQSSPFNVDFLGSARPGTDGIWSRGAFEVAGAQAQGPTPPLNLTASVQ